MVEGGEYHCAVGASSRDLRSTTTVDVAGDDARVPLTADSSVAEWFADPRGAELLGQAFATMTGTGAAEGDGGGPLAQLSADPAFMLFLGSLPIGRISAFPGSPLTPEALAKLIAAAND